MVYFVFVNVIFLFRSCASVVFIVFFFFFCVYSCVLVITALRKEPLNTTKEKNKKIGKRKIYFKLTHRRDWLF